ncbi:YbfB/YjiJ family MFS transporter [Tersicoccus sp. Bi-70]|uniref:YbfB/YjiJ family MFS transporter n=1 Tax=Tersicoccus sp. Bi-70 TaxID=1897634 RepID=UPI0009787BC1|nr:YbfB/YjiJ family MFS transporter [Tersicoccus sp. Bi-70]OMH32504.1 MFS transporter [Tersicoccus sp. Bi-70]
MAIPVEERSTQPGWSVALRTAAVLAAAMGVGRFVFTPILPLMEAQAGLSPQQASLLATGNYLGYLVGAVLGILVPTVSRSRPALQISGVVLVVTLAVMPLVHDVATWVALRGIAGVASAVVFMVAGNTILTQLARSAAHLVGWAYGGVGAGIALSGILVAIVQQVGDWQTAWWSAAALTVVLLAIGWPVGEVGRRRAVPAAQAGRQERHLGLFGLLSASYVLEGAGYIIAGTFLVAAVHATAPGWLSAGVWIIVGLASLPSSALWSRLSSRASRPTLIAGALLLQAIGIALPALSESPAAAIASAVLFGATFIGVTTLSLATGRQLGVSSAVAILTAGYGVGQVAGPLIVAPLLGSGYRTALLVGAGIVLAAAVAAGLMRLRFPLPGRAGTSTPIPSTPTPSTPSSSA